MRKSLLLWYDFAMELGLLIAGLEGVVVRGSLDGIRIGDVTEDSRTVMPGSLFVARDGLNFDGRSFIHAAIRDGAVAILTDAEGTRSVEGVPVLIAADPGLACAQVAERFYGDPTRSLKLAGITGTNGKTTTAHIAHTLINAGGTRAGLIGTVEIDDGIERAPSEMTTMPAIELSRTFAVMREQGCEAAVMEVSSHALHQRRTAAIDFDVAVFTNLTPEHLDYHGTMEAYVDAKAMLFGSLGAGATAIVNMDDPAHAVMLRGCRAEAMLCTAAGAMGADCEVRQIERSIAGTMFELIGPWGTLSCRVPLLGGYNGMNLLQSCCIAWVMGVDRAGLEAALPAVTPPPGRMEYVTPVGSPVSVVVDYAHTDDALERVLEALKPLVSRRLWVVFGAGGDRDTQKRARMGEVASRLADRIVLTSDNPRREDASSIIAEILRGIPDTQRERVVVHPNRKQAIIEAITLSEPGDTVLIAGKGHETTQSLPDGHGGVRVIDFDDRIIARDALGLPAGA